MHIAEAYEQAAWIPASAGMSGQADRWQKFRCCLVDSGISRPQTTATPLDLNSMSKRPSPAVSAQNKFQRISTANARVVVLTAYEGMRLLDLTGPLDAFALANDVATGPAPYALRTVSANGGPVRTSSGLAVSTEPLSALDGTAIDTLIVGGGAEAFRANSTPETVHAWLASQSPLVEWIGRRGAQARRLCSVCTGTFFLAKAGALTGRTVTTHWAAARLLGNCFPGLRVEPDLIFGRDGMIWTSGGITAGIDLALALIEDDLGGDYALRIARLMVVFATRPGGQSQYAVPFTAPVSDRGDFSALHAWMAENIARNFGIDELAARAGMSRRTFMRAYAAATGRTPAKTIETMRIDAARLALEASSKTLKHIARETGFGDEDRMRRVFLRRIRVSPSDYRARFSLRTLAATAIQEPWNRRARGVS
jgi:transcriptional regulator GlxA family with amidase domain